MKTLADKILERVEEKFNIEIEQQCCDEDSCCDGCDDGICCDDNCGSEEDEIVDLSYEDGQNDREYGLQRRCYCDDCEYCDGYEDAMYNKSDLTYNDGYNDCKDDEPRQCDCDCDDCEYCNGYNDAIEEIESYEDGETDYENHNTRQCDCDDCEYCNGWNTAESKHQKILRNRN